MCRPILKDIELKFIWTDSNNSDFKYFSDCLEEYFNVLVGGEENRKSFIPHNSLELIKDVIIAYEEEKAVACASFKKFDEQTAEMKRVWVLPEYRKRHIASELIKRLEKHAYDNGYKEMVLQTRAVCNDAVELYKSFGYVQIENYPPYDEMSEAVCYKKSLGDELS